MDSCKICQAPTKNKCSNCNQTCYCSVEHQRQDWKLHKLVCFPFKIEQNEELGRHLVATRTIKPFEIVLKEAPLIRGPSQVTGPVCLGCLNAINPSDYINCEMCGWPLCGVECNLIQEHAAECGLTARRERKVNVQEFTNPHPLYQCISTVRCLYLKETNKENWKKFQNLESLEDQRKGSNQWKVDLESIGKFIPKFFNTKDFSEDEIMKMIGILQINGHEVPTTDPPHVAVYYNASLLEHCCVPNLAKSFTKDGHIVFFAPYLIKKNAHLSICYSDSIWGTADRQQHLMQTKLFKCNCLRCSDVTEFNTNYSGIKCDNNNCEGHVFPKDFRKRCTTWQCNVCKATTNKTEVDKILERTNTDLQSMQKTVDNCLKFIQHYQKWLPPTHYFICEVIIQLIQLIGKDPKELMVVNNELLQMKIKFTREMISVYEQLAPCEVRLLGMLCFELHSALAENTRRISLQTGLSSKDMLQESLVYVEKCVNYLQFESDIFVEGSILKQARINRNALRVVLRM